MLAMVLIIVIVLFFVFGQMGKMISNITAPQIGVVYIDNRDRL